ncbi:MAG TPA: alkaline phosphatase PhoX, partial [Solirubrobacteraceae bacterium]|nr:alkaline phosphatase PhoX [Solirubrobacteraceae bacterium]
MGYTLWEMSGGLRRRDFIGTGLAAAGALTLGRGFWSQALAAPARPGPGPYGALRAPDANGLMLPPGFSSRLLARGNAVVPGTGYPWHVYPDGGATFPAPGGGWVYVSNSESLAASGAGASAMRFRPDGSIDSAYRILSGTNVNCAGGPTPWGTWLSCEEYDLGHVWECDPQGRTSAVLRAAMGAFKHEAACADPRGRQLYMTEDEGSGGLYRFTPARWPDLSDGLLEVAVGAPTATRLGWARVPDPSALTGATRTQAPGMRRFASGEGIWWDEGVVYFTTKGDNVVWAYDTRTQGLDKVYDRAATPTAALRGVDNIVANRAGELYVCEDGGDMEIVLITPDRVLAPFCKLTGPAAVSSEMAGVAFSPDGRRMYFSSQRGLDWGATYEVAGPFATTPRPPAPGGGARPARPRPPLRLSVSVRRGIGLRRLVGQGLELTVR